MSEKREKKAFRGYRVDLGADSIKSFSSALTEIQIEMEVEKTVDLPGME